MASDADPAREVLRERMTRQQLCDLSDMNCNAAHLFSRLSNFWEGTACTLAEESEYAHAQLAARTTERDQVAHERDALRAEVEKLRAAQTAPPQPLTTTETQPAPHTPGPWIVEDTGTHLWIGPPRSDGSGKVADIVVSMDIAQFTPEARARAIANACLIAAAPDLRASRPASLGDKAREVAQACMNAVKIGAKPWSEDNARQYEFARERVFMLAKHLTDADLAPDPVANDGRDVVRAAKRFLLVDEDENASADDCDEARRLLGEALLEYDEDLRAARAKGGAS